MPYPVREALSARIQPRLLALLSLLGLGFMAEVGYSQEGGNTGFAACEKVANDKERLSCYDRVQARSHTDAQKQPAAATAASEISPQSLFGATPSSEAPAAAPRQKDIKSILAQVTEVHQNASGGVTVTLDNGQRWQQLEHADLLLKVGDHVKIFRGMLGSFYLMTPADRTAGVKRIQ
jgi:hypothetical protein